MVDELHTFSKPRLVLLVMQLIQVAILRATHEDSSIPGPNNRGHFDVGRDGQVGGVEFDFFVDAVVGSSNGGGRDANKKYRYWGTYDQEGRYFVNKYTGFRFDDGNMGYDVRLIHKGADFLPVQHYMWKRWLV